MRRPALRSHPPTPPCLPRAHKSMWNGDVALPSVFFDSPQTSRFASTLSILYSATPPSAASASRSLPSAATPTEPRKPSPRGKFSVVPRSPSIFPRNIHARQPRRRGANLHIRCVCVRALSFVLVPSATRYMRANEPRGATAFSATSAYSQTPFFFLPPAFRLHQNGGCAAHRRWNWQRHSGVQRNPDHASRTRRRQSGERRGLLG